MLCMEWMKVLEWSQLPRTGNWASIAIERRKVRHAIHQQLTLYHANQKLKNKYIESRKLVAEQLLGVSEVMGDFAKEIEREQNNHDRARRNDARCTFRIWDRN